MPKLGKRALGLKKARKVKADKYLKIAGECSTATDKRPTVTPAEERLTATEERPAVTDSADERLTDEESVRLTTSSLCSGPSHSDGDQINC